MSDDDFDVELLALAGDGERRRRKRQNSSSGKPPAAKRRKADVKDKSDSDMEPESEEDDSNPYPLDGKYVDEADRARLLQMPEIEREGLLATRQEELQRRQDKLNLDHMLKVQSGNVDSEHVSQAAKRKHAVRGATKEKTRKLDEIKAKRKAKEERVRTHKEKTSSPSQRRRSMSSEPELSDVTDEEGEINKEEEERKFKESVGTPKLDNTPTREQFEKLRVSRQQIMKNYHAPWFDEWITGAWVRYLIGNDDTTREPIYRICEVKGMSPTVGKNYQINDLVVNRAFDLKHGAAVRTWPMDKVSDSPFTQKEFDRLVVQLKGDKVDFPGKRTRGRKIEQLAKLPTTPLTEACTISTLACFAFFNCILPQADITAMIARKNALNPKNVAISQAFAARAQLTQQRNLALKRQDYKEAAQIDQELETLASVQEANGNGKRERGQDSHADLMARVNERNRKANLEAVRLAEAAQAARKRQERKAAAAGLAAGRPVIFDVSARVKTVPRIHHSRSGTPHGTPTLKTNDSVERSVSPLPPLPSSGLSAPAKTRPAQGSFEARMVESINIQLDDF
ncbi:hypothetical protein JB92DRAFT_3124151 [Gautieria morchelliformis]|nr:hypothetical protein JB92DRAFT_3124151 [Gautieria morchelliformis]